MNSHAQSFSDEAVSIMKDPALMQIVFVGSKTHFPDCLSRMIVAEIEGCTTVRLSAPADLAIAIAEQGLRPRLVIVDDSLWGAMDDDLLHRMRTDHRVAIAIAFRDVAHVTRVLFSPSGVPNGISFLPMDLNIESWLTILRLVLTGYPFVPSEVMLAMDAVASRPLPEHAAIPERMIDGFEKLTPREHEVLALVAEGLQNKHIADRLALSEHTVKLHLHHVISKLGARNRTDAALRYRRQDRT